MAASTGLKPTDVVRVSKTLSYLLRHGAEKEGFQLLPGGYLFVDDILLKKRFHTVVTVEDIQYIVDNNDKKRYTMVVDESTQRLKIRANQGHSLQVGDLDLKPIDSADDYPIIVHGTYHKYWPSIAEMGLKRMNRNHIHMAAGMPGQDGVISGMRSSCQIIIYINMEKALQEGLKFFLSANGVILSPGDESGVISTVYFAKVVDRKTGRKLPYPGSPESTKADKEDEIQEVCGAAKDMVVTPDDIADEFEKKPRRKKKNKA